MSNTNQTHSSINWMLNVGVDKQDVEWLLENKGSKELHYAENSLRVESIYTRALEALIASPARMTLLQSASIN